MNAFYEDNNGGDIIQILDNKNGTYTFQVAWCCVYVLKKTGTISEITKWLADITFILPMPHEIETIEKL